MPRFFGFQVISCLPLLVHIFVAEKDPQKEHFLDSAPSCGVLCDYP